MTAELSPAPHPTAPPRTMRVVPEPDLPPALDAAIDRWLEASPPALSGIRIAAASALRRIGLPHSGTEDFSFLRTGDLRPLLEAVPPGAILPDAGTKDAADSREGRTAGPESFIPDPDHLARYVVPECRDNFLVLVDGVFSPEWSRPGEGVGVVPLAESAPPDSPLPGMHLRFQGLHAAFLNRLEAVLEEEEDPPAALAALFATEPLLIRIAAKRTSQAPLQILHVAARAGRGDALIVLQGGAQSESRIFVRHLRREDLRPETADGKETASSARMENIATVALLEEGASLAWTELGAAAGQAVPGSVNPAVRGSINPAGSGRPTDTPSSPAPSAGETGDASGMHLRKFSARLERDARLTAVSAHTGSRLTRTAFGIDLAGEGSEAGLYGAAVLSGSRQGHQHIRLRHLVPHCSSRQMFKTVAADKSRGSVDGTIVVALDAQQTNAGQLINNLMLSDDARVDSKPRLLIHADDVKCSHGATVGKLDPAQLFYLVSRGLPAERARSLLTVAFIAEALEKAGAPGDAIRDALDHALLDALRARMPATGAVVPGNSQDARNPRTLSADATADLRGQEGGNIANPGRTHG